MIESEVSELTDRQIAERTYKLLQCLVEVLKPKERKTPSPKTIVPLKQQLEPFVASTPPREIEKFLNYWTEQNKKGIELWQTKPTWEVGKRLKRWMMNVDERNYKESQRFIKEPPKPYANRIEGIDVGFEKPNFSKYLGNSQNKSVE